MRWLALVLLLAAPVTAAAEPTYPSFAGWVVDRAQVLDAAARKELEDLAARLDASSLAQLAVVVVPAEALGGMPRTDYAVELFRRFQLGHGPDQNDGLLLLFVTGAAGHRGLKVEVGYDLEPILPDGKVGALMDRHAGPHLREGEYGAAAIALSESFARILQDAGPQRHGARKARIRALARHAGSQVAVGATLLGFALAAWSGWRRHVPRYSLIVLAAIALIAGAKGLFQEGTQAGAFGLVFAPVLGALWWLLLQRACRKCGRWVVYSEEIVGETGKGRRRIRGTFECAGVAKGRCDYRRTTEFTEETRRARPTPASVPARGGSGGPSGSSGPGSSFGGGGGGASGGGGADREY